MNTSASRPAHTSCRAARPATLGALGAAILMAGSIAMANDNPAATVTLKAAPSGAQNHTLEVKLDAQGDWSVVPASTVKMRVAYAHQWSQQPNKGKSNWARIYIGEAKNPKNGEMYYDPANMHDLGAAQIMQGSGALNVNIPFKLLVQDGIPGANVAGYCSFEKDNQLKSGKTLHEVLAKGFNVNITTPIRMTGFYDLGGGPNTSRPVTSNQYNVDGKAPVIIHCAGNTDVADKIAPLPKEKEPMGPAGLVGKDAISAVQLVAVDAKASTVCPVDVTLKATLSGSGGAEVKYWLEEIGGNGAAQMLSTTLPGKTGEPGMKTVNARVTLRPGPQDQLPPQGIDAIKSNAPAQGTLVKRSYRINVVAPNKIASDKLELAVMCTSTVNFGGPGGLQVAPPKPAEPAKGLSALPPVLPTPHPVGPASQLQAAPPAPPKPAIKLQAAPAEPAKPGVKLQSQ